MEVKSLGLHNFRKYENLKLEFCSGVNVITGQNGLGKTTLLEALYLCTCARSHKTAKDKELIKHGEHEYKVSINFNYEADNKIELENKYIEKIDISYLEANSAENSLNRNQRFIHYNDVRLAKLAEMMGIFNAVIFCPEDINLVKDSPAGRRRFIDLLISQLDNNYFISLQMYQSILIQRNKLLKILREQLNKNKNIDSKSSSQLEIWDMYFADKASTIIFYRIKYINKLKDKAKKYHSSISDNKEILDLAYQTVRGIDVNMSKEDIADLLIKNLEKNRTEDIYRGSSSIGPHRDDIDIKLDDYALKAFGSQGQQRTAVLALKLAELELIKEKRGEMPVLLLDDVLPELDENRRLSLIESLKTAQVFITCTDVEEVQEKMKNLLIEKGSRNFKVLNNSVEML